MTERKIAGPGLAAIHSASADRPYVVAQLGQSLDGRIATLSGHSQWINGGDALDHLHALRASVDAVIVGAGTIIADDPQLTVRRVAGTHPARIVIDPNGRTPHHAKCFHDTGTPRFCVRATPGPTPSGVQAILVKSDGNRLAPAAIIEALFALGMRRILIEGGADTISRFIDADMVDRLHVLLAPVILGSGRPGLNLRPIQTVTEAMRPHTATHVFRDGDVLFDCDLRAMRSDLA
jgi:riboflavin-specific deaminase-like protein